MIWFFTLALLGTLFTGPHPYGTELFAVDRGCGDWWHMEAVASERTLEVKKATSRRWAEGDIVRVTTAGSFVRAVVHEDATHDRRQAMQALLNRVLQSSESSSEPEAVPASF